MLVSIGIAADAGRQRLPFSIIFSCPLRFRSTPRCCVPACVSPSASPAEPIPSPCCVPSLRDNHERGRELGLVLHAAHLHHGLRGEEADADLEFARKPSPRASILPFHQARVDTAAEAKPNPATGKPAESIEEAARRLRYAWFRQLLSKSCPAQGSHRCSGHGPHPRRPGRDRPRQVPSRRMDRGSIWNSSGPRICRRAGFCARSSPPPAPRSKPISVRSASPGAKTPRIAISPLRAIAFATNCCRCSRPGIRACASIWRRWPSWPATKKPGGRPKLARLAPQLILPGRPVRGGGRAAADGCPIDIARLGEQPMPLCSAGFSATLPTGLGVTLDFPATESLRNLAATGRASQKLELASRSARRADPSRTAPVRAAREDPAIQTVRKLHRDSVVSIPGEVEAPTFGLRLRIEVCGDPASSQSAPNSPLCFVPGNPAIGFG